MEHRADRMIVISGPSGVGKSSLIEGLMERAPRRYELVRSATTRPPRGGKDFYYHVTPEEFDSFPGGFLETNLYGGNGKRYGTPRRDVERVLDSGRIPILDIDFHGLYQVREKEAELGARVESVFVVISPGELLDRLVRRDTETPETIKGRLETALTEVEQVGEYDVIICNDVLDEAVSRLEAALDHRGEPSVPFDVEGYQTELRDLIERTFG